MSVDDRLYMEGEDFTPNPVKKHKIGAAWEPVDDEAKAAYTAAGSPRAYTGTVDVVAASVPADWQAEATKAGWQPASKGDAPVDPSYGAAPPATSAAAASAAAPVEAKPVVDDNEI